MRKLQAFLLALWISFASHAADTYDTATSRLSIPLVKSGETYYSNVEIVLGSVLSVGTQSAEAVPYDTYDATTNRLTIPVVYVGSATYYNVVITVAKVLSVGSTCATLDACSTSASTGKDAAAAVAVTVLVVGN